MKKQMVGSWQLSGLPVPLQFVAFADAYLDAAARLCKILKRSSRKSTYPRAAVIEFLIFHAVELFLKAAILQKKPNESLHHKIEHYEKRYRNLYTRKKYAIDIPFKTEYLGFKPAQIAARKASIMPTFDQINRYPADKKGKKWSGIYAIDPSAVLMLIDNLQADFRRLQVEIFPDYDMLKQALAKSQ